MLTIVSMGEEVLKMVDSGVVVFYEVTVEGNMRVGRKDLGVRAREEGLILAVRGETTRIIKGEYAPLSFEEP